MRQSAWKFFCLGFGAVLVFTLGLSSADADTNKPDYKAWITEMKQSPKGPFWLVRWFCDDGTVWPAKPYPCEERGGGVQHGELNKKAKQLRKTGYKIANVFAAIDPNRFFRSPAWRDDLGQMLIEQFLIGYDDGWILRGARFYRGALQVEDEVAGAEELLGSLFVKVDKQSEPNSQDFLLLREAYRLLPRQRKSASVVSARNMATRINDKDENFIALRTKIHGQPEPSDAQRVRAYSSQSGLAALAKDYEKLAQTIERIHKPATALETLNRFARSLGKGELKTALLAGAEDFSAKANPEQRLLRAASLLRKLRERYPHFRTNYTRRGALELSLKLEQEAFTAGNKLAQQAAYSKRAHNLKWLKALGSAIYGSGFISQREWRALDGAIANLSKPALPLQQYRSQLRYLNRTPGWANSWLKFHLSDAVRLLSRIEPLSAQIIPDRLRSSPLLPYGQILGSLLKDANALSGVEHQLFGHKLGAGLRALNPGLARGVLRLSHNGQLAADKNSIVLLPETTAELAPVAGILTQGAGNALSHVQLLAGNLGIPNVVIENTLEPLLSAREDHLVVLAVSPGGVVQLEADNAKWHEYFSRQITPREGNINPDLEKLDTQFREFVSLADLRTTDAGRICGPKAANLGELKFHFPAAVTSGLVVPFGEFRALLEQPYADSGMTAFVWMQNEYRRIRQLDDESRLQASLEFLQQLRGWILHSDPGDAFRQRLARRLQEIFGSDGSYAVFVRSDTNVEDLPGFTGAGLNLTVPNVRGFDNIVEAILKVWASPFKERAFAWRQQRMASPEHVYPSVLLMKSVSVDKSGVLLTIDTETGDRGKLTIAVNHGIGGAVQGQSAEELAIDPVSGEIRLLADATAAKQRVLNRKGGLVRKQLGATGRVLADDEIQQLVRFVQQLENKFPLHDESGQITAADVEFGFDKGQLVLFQVRPYLQNRRVKKNHYLNMLDGKLKQSEDVSVNMDEAPTS